MMPKGLINSGFASKPILSVPRSGSISRSLPPRIWAAGGEEVRPSRISQKRPVCWFIASDCKRGTSLHDGVSSGMEVFEGRVEGAEQGGTASLSNAPPAVIDAGVE